MVEVERIPGKPETIDPQIYQISVCHWFQKGAASTHRRQKRTALDWGKGSFRQGEEHLDFPIGRNQSANGKVKEREG